MLARPGFQLAAVNAAVRVRTIVPSVAAVRRRPVYTATAPSHSPRRGGVARHPAFEDLSIELKDLPEFPTRAEQVRILNEPSQFYQTLLHHISLAKHRIFIASLYVGKEEHQLAQALYDALRRSPELKLVLLLDYLRSTRELPSPSSASLLGSLTAAFPKQVELRLYHTPNLVGWRKKMVPRRFDEGWGLQHIKCYGFDDTVIISGANLSDDYFTNRQDRYMEFSSHAPLADYFSSLLERISSFSYLATAIDTSTQHPAIDIRWPNSNIGSSPIESAPSFSEDLKLAAGNLVNTLTKQWASRSPSDRAGSSSSRTGPPFDTSVRPVIQMGLFDVKQETDMAVPSIFKTANALATAPGGAATTLNWTSGYFSVHEQYKAMVLSSKAGVRIVAASPEANGFHNSRGVSKYIPPAYTHLQHQFYKQMIEQSQRRDRESHVELREWKRQGWTYHAKGIWLTPSLTSPTRFPHNHSPRSDYNDLDGWIRHTHPVPPWLTVIGSSNYGSRSASRDLEANVLLTTSSPRLRKTLGKELEALRSYAVDIVNEELFKRKDRVVPWGVRIAAKVIEDML
ncbi:BZ3500_MvSof-1268-A1-R1_Chr1-3g01568 [Microbotryum saponariae]|uniref:CDP-diacylglycerol--glycerol-3-phosphate 3-phosphatidyltransferase n=1 Tax=Microbotryum saponariae TaxID=289078 RepID=A0A2X0M674_9BASI|nr:BZ3500_MvSof-1268-A1-R1_Chr1-3g01568 [Microbotryum saponariae]SCZ94053.1 BZ3501_MvSof-1269-A2-R1_Chr1-3g01170 [Microbotryum saponariae]